MRTLTIGQAANHTGLSVKAIRFYERIGLIPAPERDLSSGYRRYSESDVKRLALIRRAKLLGLRLSQIKQIVEVLKHDGCNCKRLEPQLENIVDDQLEELERKLQDLTMLKKELQELKRKSRNGPLPRGFCVYLD